MAVVTGAARGIGTDERERIEVRGLVQELAAELGVTAPDQGRGFGRVRDGDEASDPEVSQAGIIDAINRVDGSGGRFLHMKGGGSINPASRETLAEGLHYIHQEGRDVYKFAVKGMAGITAEVVEKNGFTGKDVDLFVPHQANMRIISAAAKKLDMPMERVIVTVDEHGNTSAASVPLALDTAVRDGRIQRGQLLMLEAFGGGFTWASALVKY